MRRRIQWSISCLGLCLILGACGGVERSTVQARNLATGEIATFPGEDEVPEGYVRCSDIACVIPREIGCKELGPDVCVLQPDCQLMPLWCKRELFAGVVYSTDVVTKDAACEYACVPKLPLQCEELQSEKACLANAECEWGPVACPAMLGYKCPLEGSCHAKTIIEPPLPPEKGCRSDFDCARGEYCMLSEGCGKLGNGVCVTLGAIACPELYGPVCGCDGQTYSNKCFAQAAGMSILHVGECEAEPPPFPPGACKEDATCPAGFACVLFPGSERGYGICEPVDWACTLEYAPVCGVDGLTYGNACEAKRAGIMIAHDGECELVPPTQGCRSDLECAKGEFCLFREGCGKLELGACQPLSQACLTVYDPVCGCDGKTYGNACEANGAGISVAAPGSCGSEPEPELTYCDELEMKYAMALEQAKSCNPTAQTLVAQCSTAMPSSLACQACMTFVDNASTLLALQKEWSAAGCKESENLACACAAPKSGNCVADSSGGTCQSF